jgi:hypothetical protein
LLLCCFTALLQALLLYCFTAVLHFRAYCFAALLLYCRLYCFTALLLYCILERTALLLSWAERKLRCFTSCFTVPIPCVTAKPLAKACCQLVAQYVSLAQYVSHIVLCVASTPRRQEYSVSLVLHGDKNVSLVLHGDKNALSMLPASSSVCVACCQLVAQYVSPAWAILFF